MNKRVAALALQTAGASWRAEFPVGWPEYLSTEEIKARLRKRGFRFDPAVKYEKVDLLRHVYEMLDQLEQEKRSSCFLHVLVHRAERLQRVTWCAAQRPYVTARLWPGGEPRSTAPTGAGPAGARPIWDPSYAGSGKAGRTAEQPAGGGGGAGSGGGAASSNGGGGESGAARPRAGTEYPADAPDGDADGAAAVVPAGGTAALPSPVLDLHTSSSGKGGGKKGGGKGGKGEGEGEGETRRGGVPGGDAPGPHHLVWRLPFRPARSDQNYVVFDVHQPPGAALPLGSDAAGPLIARSGKVRLHKLVKEEGGSAAATASRGYAGAAPQWVRLDGRGKMLCTAYFEFVPLKPGEKPPPSPTRASQPPASKRSVGTAGKKVLGWAPPTADTNRVLFWAVGLLILVTSGALAFLASQKRAELASFFRTCHSALQAAASAQAQARAPAAAAPPAAGGGHNGGEL
jgi:hypothetical protein